MFWIGGESEDKVMREGEEEDSGLFGCGDEGFPEEFQVVKEADGYAKFVKVVVGWGGMEVTEVAAKVGGKELPAQILLGMYLLGTL